MAHPGRAPRGIMIDHVQKSQSGSTHLYLGDPETIAERTTTLGYLPRFVIEFVFDKTGCAHTIHADASNYQQERSACFGNDFCSAAWSFELCAPCEVRAFL